MISYFADQQDGDVLEDSKFLLTKFRFLYKDPLTKGALKPEDCFMSPFLYELLATTHLSDISGYVPVEGWDLKEWAKGKDGVGVIAIACVAVGIFICLCVCAFTDYILA